MKPTLTPDLPFEEGYILPIDKPLEWSSSDVVRKIKVMLRRLGYRKIKIGHAGTLDPLATGVLLICIGKATKQAERLQAETKEYLTTITLGATTPSYDRELAIDHTYPYEHITPEATQQAVQEMIGPLEQLPPTYSAKLIDGRRAYQYAREGAEVEMRRSSIEIYDAAMERFELPEVTLRITCSKGTYIRSIARDLGVALESGGHLKTLCRTRSGGYSVEGCYQIEEVERLLTPPHLAASNEANGGNEATGETRQAPLKKRVLGEKHKPRETN